MFRQAILILFLLAGLAFSVSCDAKQDSPTPAPNLANPASVYCEQHEGKIRLRQDPQGGVIGICVFPDGSACDEWSYLRGECKPGDKPMPSGSTSSPVRTRPTSATTQVSPL